MKRFFALIALIAVVSLSATAAMAADSAAGATGVSTTANTSLKAVTPSGATIAKASKNVTFGWNTTSTGYSLATFHASGTKSYGTGYDSTKLYFNDATAVAAPSSSLASTSFANWTAM